MLYLKYVIRVTVIHNTGSRTSLAILQAGLNPDEGILLDHEIKKASEKLVVSRETEVLVVKCCPLVLVTSSIASISNASCIVQHLHAIYLLAGVFQRTLYPVIPRRGDEVEHDVVNWGELLRLLPETKAEAEEIMKGAALVLPLKNSSDKVDLHARDIMQQRATNAFTTVKRASHSNMLYPKHACKRLVTFN